MGMGAQVGELVTAADIGKRLSLSAERIRQLHREGALPAPAGRVGRNTLWFWETIADWAAATGRLDRADRPSTQAWNRSRSGRKRFHRSADCVIPWGEKSLVHARVWLPSEKGLRAVVLLGELDDNPGMSITNGIEEAATTVAAQLIGSSGAAVDWYHYVPAWQSYEPEFTAVTFHVGRPSGGRRRRAFSGDNRRLSPAELQDPEWAVIERDVIERLVGEEIEVYPRGAYTSDVIRRRRSQDSVEVEWDPANLRPDIDAATRILECQADIGRECSRLTSAILSMEFDDRVQMNLEAAAKQPRGLGVILRPYHPASEVIAEIEALSFDERVLGLARSPDAVAAAQQQLREWLLKHGTEADRLLLVPGPLGLAWLSSIEAGRDIDDDASLLTNAVRHADRGLADFIHYCFRDVSALDYPFSVPSDVNDATSEWATQYLKTVAWWGPKSEDASRVRRLVKRIGPTAKYAAGYDPWNRMVLQSDNTFVVEWPVGPRTSMPPDNAVIVAQQSDQFSTPVFIALDDGRLDLLPVAPEGRRSLGFAWGYGGGGPHTLARALQQLLVPSSMLDQGATWDAVYDLVVNSKAQTLRIPFYDLRRLLSGERSPMGSR